MLCAGGREYMTRFFEKFFEPQQKYVFLFLESIFTFLMRGINALFSILMSIRYKLSMVFEFEIPIHKFHISSKHLITATIDKG